MSQRKPTRWIAVVALLLIATGIYSVSGRKHIVGQSTTAVVQATQASTLPSTTSSVTPAPTTSPAPTTDPAATSSPATPARAQAQPLRGVQLAEAWLRGYLTRPKGATDASWQATISPLSDPALVKTLTAASTTNPVGITYPSWAVTSIKPTRLPSQPIDTPTRQTSSWLVTIASPTKASSVRLYTLTAYLGDTGWTIAQADQGYTSEG